MAEVKCPHPSMQVCGPECGYYMDGKCAMVRIAEELAVLAAAKKTRVVTKIDAKDK